MRGGVVVNKGGRSRIILLRYAWFFRSGSPRSDAYLRGGLVFEAHRLCVSLNSRLESNKEEERSLVLSVWVAPIGCVPADVNLRTEMCSGSEAGSYLRLIDFCTNQL